MVFFNWATMQMAAKIVYYGPGLCGKTSNLSYIYAKTTPNSRGEMVSLETESDRTLFFDLLPIEVGTIGGFKTRLQLYTVPGQVFYNTTRKLVLKGVDGLVFVADSQRPMRDSNVESLKSLIDNIEDLGLDMTDLPLVMQFNKRDLQSILTVEELNGDLNPRALYPHFEASAITGDGVFETLKEITKLTLKKLRKRMTTPQVGGIAPAGEPVRPVRSPKQPESISAASLARAAEEGVISNTDSPPAPVSPPDDEDTDVFTAGLNQPGASVGRGPFDANAQPIAESAENEPVAASLTDTPVESTATEAQEQSGGERSSPAFAGDNSPAHHEMSEGSKLGKIAVKSETDPAIDVDFGRHADDEPHATPPPVKRVHVSNQLDILAELEGLRSGSFSDSPSSHQSTSTSEIDIDSLISGAMGGGKEIRRRIEQGLDPDIFEGLRGVEMVIHVKGAKGNTIHTLAPVVLEVENAGELKKLSLRFAIDLEKSR